MPVLSHLVVSNLSLVNFGTDDDMIFEGDDVILVNE
jgi:hypothetical protein